MKAVVVCSLISEWRKRIDVGKRRGTDADRIEGASGCLHRSVSMTAEAVVVLPVRGRRLAFTSDSTDDDGDDQYDDDGADGGTHSGANQWVHRCRHYGASSDLAGCQT